MQSAAMEQALAASRKRAVTFAWPAKKGQSSEQCKRQALRSIERGVTRANQGPRPPLATLPAELTRFNGIDLPELTPEDPFRAEDEQTLFPSKLDGFGVDENGHPVNWPWESASRTTRSKAPPGIWP